MQQTQGEGTRPHVRHVRKHDVTSWHEAICEAFCHTHYIPRPEPEFVGELSLASQGGARVSRVHSSPGRFERDREAIRRDGFDSLVMLVSLRGDIHLTQNGESHVTRRGEALVYRHGTPFEIQFPRRYWAVSLRVDPALVLRHCPSVAVAGAAVIRPETTNGLLALTMVRELCVNAITRDTSEMERLVGAALDVVSTVGPRPDATGGARNEWMFDTLARYLSRNIDDAELNQTSLAAAAGVSPRTLNRMFAHRGTTPMRWVLDRRLELAYEMLAAQRVRTVTEAAYAFGFKDGSHFSRAFSRKFGVPPISVLRRS